MASVLQIEKQARLGKNQQEKNKRTQLKGLLDDYSETEQEQDKIIFRSGLQILR
jgi:hypothetical protein